MNKKTESRSRVLSLILALAMMITTLIPVVAGASGEPEPKLATSDKTNEVVLHKLIVAKDDLGTWDENGSAGYDGTQDLAAFNQMLSKNYTETQGVYFAWQNKDGDWIDGSGNVVAVDNENLLGAETGPNGISFNTSQLPAGEYKIVEIPERSTYVGTDGSTLTGGKAVPVKITLPFYNESGLQTKVHVYPKNTEDKPKIDKDFEGDLGDGADVDNPGTKETKDLTIGDEVPYHIQTLIPADTKYAVLKWSDRMSKGLTFTRGSVQLVAEGLNLENGTHYNITEYSNGFDLVFTQAGLNLINEKGTATKIDIRYGAVLNDDAAVGVEQTNDVKLVYGNKPEAEVEVPEITPNNGEIKVTKSWADGEPPTGVTATFDLYDKDNNLVDTVTLTKAPWEHTFTGLKEANGPYKVMERVNGYTPEYTLDQYGVAVKNTKGENPTPLDPEEPKAVTGGKKFIKTDKDQNPLIGASFYVTDSEKDGQYLGLKDQSEQNGLAAKYEEAEAAYQQAIKDKDTANIPKLKEDRDEAYKNMNTQWKWVNTKDEAFIFYTDAEGKFEVPGLAYETYYLEEKDVPEGYATPGGRFKFVVSETSWTQAPQGIPHVGEYQVIVNNKVTIPETGGIGSMIFFVAGLAIMGAVIVIKRRNAAQA